MFGQFTEREIELAQLLKEAGLEWKPSFGDVVLIKDKLLTREYRNVLEWRGLIEDIDIHDVLSTPPPLPKVMRSGPKDNCFTGIVIGTLNLLAHGDIEVAVWDSRRWIVSSTDTTWLPLGHQCREIMLKKDWRLTLMDTPPQVEWRIHIVFKRLIDKEVHCIETTGMTDLEAMYKALLGVITNASKNVNND